MTKSAYSRKTVVDRLLEAIEPDLNSGCWLWSRALDRHGYGRLKIGEKTHGAHRLSWMMHRGTIPTKLCVLHRCDTPACVNPAHLFLGTQAENMADMAAKGRHVGYRGELHPQAKLSAADAVEIRALSGGVLQCELAARFGVSPSTIRHIQKGSRWA